MSNGTQPKVLKEGTYSQEDLDALRVLPDVQVRDIYKNQLYELFKILNPTLIKSPDLADRFEGFYEERVEKNLEVIGDWIYYEWTNTLVHTLSEEENYELRTNRNKNIITAEEQKKLSNFSVAIAGLSVGGNIATTLLYTGISRNRLKLADFDTLETTNLNRVRGRLTDIGDRKIDIVKRQLFELDPYIEVETFETGLSEESLTKFVAGEPKTGLVFEIIDDFKMKIMIRKEAKKQRVPVVMLTSIGDRILIDIERYDTEPETKIFNGKVEEEVLEDILAGKLTLEDEKRYALQIVGLDNLPQRVVESVKSIGQTLVGRPQLMSTVTIASGIASFITRKIALGDELPSGRSLVRFDDFFNHQ